MAPFSFLAMALVEPVVGGQLLGQLIGHRIPVGLVGVNGLHPCARRVNQDGRTLTARGQYQRGE